MSSLEHHGIKGQKWGVRRFQNPDGTRTSEGRKRDKQERFNNATVDVLAKVSTNIKPIQKEPANIHGVIDRAKCSEDDARTCIKLADEIYARAASEEPRITKDITGIVNKTGFSMYGLDHRLKQPTSIAGKIGSDAKSNGVSYAEASKGIKDAVRYTTVSDNESFVSDYRTLKQGLESKGYEEVKCKNFFEKYRAGEVQHKAVQTTFKSPTGYEFELQFQTPESQAAKELKIPIYEERRKQGISSSRAKELEKQMRDLAEQVPYPDGIETIESHNKLKHSSIGGNMNYIYGNTLVLGDSSYLEHHGIKGQRWGVRRFQNKDGSLTNAGRKRLGYSTKDVKTALVKGGKAVGGAAVTIGKAGYNLGKKAAAAGKAHSEKKKAEKLEKKKEKASKTRLGVIANSDLFTAKEMKELNEKFKAQDEMTIASLKKGADIVTNIATIAKGVNDINSAVENVTGKSLNPFKNASNETKRQKEAAELEQARQNAKKAASQAENEATKAEKAAYEFNKQKDHDKEKAAEKEAKKQQGKPTNDNKSDDDDKPKPPTGDKPKSPDDGGGKGKSADNSPTVPVVPVEYDKNESSGSNKNRTHTLSPEQQKKLVAFKMNKTKGPDDPGDVSDEDVAKYKQVAKDADQRAKSAQDNANNIKTQRDQLDAAIRNYKLPPQQDPNYDAALSQLRAASNRSSELTSAYKKAQSEADTAKVNAYRAQREAVASEYGGSKGKNIAKDMAKRMSDASYQHEVDAIDNQRDSNKSAYDRNVAKEYIKDVLNPKKAINRKIDQVASKIADKAVNQQKEALAKERDRSRKQMSSNFEQAMKSGTLDADKAVREYYKREFNLHGAQLDKAVDNYMNAMSKRKTYRRAARHSAINIDSQALVHYGLKGQRWGVRRFQNPDGTRTAAGKARYGKANTEFSGGGGGGIPEDEDDKVKSIAEALGMDVDDYRKKVDNSPLGYKHAADKLDADAKKLHEQAEANRRMADQAKSSGYKDKAREFERNAEKCETQAKSKEGLRDYCQWRADGGTVTKAAANTINQTIDATKNAVNRAFDATANTVHDLNPGNYSIEKKRGRIKIHKKPYVSKFAHGLLVDDDGTLYLEHHGIKGQRWGVRRFQNPDGTLTDKGRKHYQKKLDREKRKQVSSDYLRGTLERQHGIAVGASGVISAIGGALTVAAVVSNPATIAAGAAVAAAVSAGITHGSYSIAEAWEGRGTRIRKKRIAKYEDMLKQDAFVENNVLYLEHHGIKGQRWGVRRFQNPDGTRTPAGLKRDAKLAAKAEKYRNKDLARYDKEIANSIDPDRKYHYEQLRKHTEKLSDKQIIAQQRYSRAVAAGEGVVSTIALSILGIPNVGSIATGVFVANSISKTTRDNVRARTVIGERTRARARNLEAALTQDVFVEDGVLYLAHHGILGQKWGIRRFQDAAGRLTAAGKQRLADVRRAVGEKGVKYKPSSSELGTTATIPGYGASDDWDDTDDEGLDELLRSLLALSDDQLKILGLSRKEIENAKTHDEKFKLVLQFKKFDNPSTKVAKVLNSISSALFGSNLLDTLNPAKITGGVLLAKLREQSAERRKAREKVDPKTGFHIKENKDASKEDDVKSVNPGFTNLSDNTKNNCMLCTTAYDLRRRGYDVTADTISQGIMSTDVKRYYPDAEVRYITDATTTRELNDKTRDALISQGEGARGNLVINWQGGGAHSMAYEVHNGDVKIYDAQSGKTHDTWDMIQHGQDVIYARLDNVEPDWDRVKEAVH